MKNSCEVPPPLYAWNPSSAAHGAGVSRSARRLRTISRYPNDRTPAHTNGRSTSVAGGIDRVCRSRSGGTAAAADTGGVEHVRKDGRVPPAWRGGAARQISRAGFLTRAGGRDEGPA